MKTFRFAVTALSAVLAISAVVACGSDAPTDGESEAQHTGTVSVALTGVANGNTYRLRNGTFNVAGPQNTSLSTETNVDAAAIQATLTVGSYQIGLQSGWFMERLAGEGYITVNASLTSANPAPFSISNNATTNVQFLFNVDGVPVLLGNGTLNLTVGVNECGAGLSACGNTCVDLQTSNANCGSCGFGCTGASTCQNGVCVASSCPAGYASCGGTCVNTMQDSNNCGACGVQCGSGFGCQNGACTFGCFAPNQQCPSDGGFACVNTQSNAKNCGFCGNACPNGMTCVFSVCQ